MLFCNICNNGKYHEQTNHTSVLIKVLWVNKAMNNPQTDNQRKAKIKKARIQLNKRQPYARHEKETFKVPEV